MRRVEGGGGDGGGGVDWREEMGGGNGIRLLRLCAKVVVPLLRRVP